MPSFDRPDNPVHKPSAWVQRYAALVPLGGTVLDLACGDGRHARYFARRGHPVVAVDVDISGVADLRGESGFDIRQADLETGDWPFTASSMAGIVIANYLHRAHFTHLPTTLSPGGVLLMETFAAGNERFGKPRNPDFLLAPGELLTALGPRLQIVAYEHGVEQTPRPAVRQRIVAVRSSDPVRLPVTHTQGHLP